MESQEVRSECPSENALVRVAHGRASARTLENVEAHMDACSGCRQLVGVIARGSAPPVYPERPLLSPGEKLGRFEIEQVLGAGGMGVVYAARDPKLERRVALKLLRSANPDETSAARLQREAQSLARLSHPNVIGIFEMGEVGDRVYLAMELVEGGTLKDWLQQPHAWRDTVKLFHAAGEGLDAAHRAGVIHRDFKPDNVVVGNDGRPRVSDFGLARSGGPDGARPPKERLGAGVQLTRTGMLVGTPAYMAPEQIAGRRADARSDQYSFCVSLFEALSTARDAGSVPAHVWAALARGLQPTGDRRFRDMGALLAALSESPSSRAAIDWRPRFGAVVWLAAAVVLAVLTALYAARSRIPAPGPIPAPIAQLEPPRPAPADEAPAAPRVQDVVLMTGGKIRLPVPHLEKVEVEGPPIIQARASGENLYLVAVGTGNTQISVVAGGERILYRVHVEAPASPPAKPGMLTLVTEPFAAKVLFGDQNLGATPLFKVPIPSGTRKLRIIQADGREHFIKVEVQPGAVTTLRLNLDESGSEVFQ